MPLKSFTLSKISCGNKYTFILFYLIEQKYIGQVVFMLPIIAVAGLRGRTIETVNVNSI